MRHKCGYGKGEASKSTALADLIASGLVLQGIVLSHFRDANLVQIGWKP